MKIILNVSDDLPLIRIAQALAMLQLRLYVDPETGVLHGEYKERPRPEPGQESVAAESTGGSPTD